MTKSFDKTDHSLKEQDTTKLFNTVEHSLKERDKKYELIIPYNSSFLSRT